MTDDEMVKTVALMAASIFPELLVYHEVGRAKDLAVKDAVQIFALVRDAFKSKEPPE